MKLACTNCFKDLIEGDMCGDCASFLRPAAAFVPEVVAPKVVKKVVKKVAKKKK
jgi:hypothetical protein